jgi:hypothetical protein
MKKILVLVIVMLMASWCWSATCIMDWRLNDNMPNSTILTNSLAPILVDTAGIANPVFSVYAETSIFKVDSSHFIGFIGTGGAIYHMTSTDGLTWSINATPILSSKEYVNVIKLGDNYYIFCNHSYGDVYCYQMLTPTTTQIMNNGNPVLVHNASSWDNNIANTGVTVDGSGNLIMLYEAYTTPLGWQTGYAHCTLTNNPPLSTDNITFTKSTSGTSICQGSAPYITYVPDRNALLAIVATAQTGSLSQLQLMTASLDDDLNLSASWKLGAVLPASIGNPSDAFLITDFSQDHPILLIWNDNLGYSFEYYINLTLNQLYDRALNLTPVVRGTAGTTTDVRTTTGRIGRAINFNPTYANYAQVGYYQSSFPTQTAPILNFNAVDWSMSFWAKQSATGTKQGLVSNAVGANVAGNKYFGIGIWATGALYFCYPPSYTYAYAANTADTAWHHYVLTFSASTHIFTIYKDKVSKLTKDCSAIDIGNLDSFLQFGAVSYPDNACFNGDFDEFKIYTGILSSAEISQLYSQGFVRQMLRGSLRHRNR